MIGGNSDDDGTRADYGNYDALGIGGVTDADAFIIGERGQRDSGIAPHSEGALSEPASDVPPALPSLAATPTTPVVAGTLKVHLTFYVCQGAPPGQSYCGTMASGNTVYEGAAACGDGMALGERFRIVGDPTRRTYTCEDRGAGPYWWVDVFWYDYASGQPWRNQFGQDVEIVRE